MACLVDGRSAQIVNSRLRPKPERPDPAPLRCNASAAYVGSYVLGTGFVLSPEERAALVQKANGDAERIFPFLGGEEVNTSPTQQFDRHVIDFGRMSLSEAGRWPDLLAVLDQRVRPERATNKRDRYREISAAVWRASDVNARIDLRAPALPGDGVRQQTPDVLFQPTCRVFSHKLSCSPSRALLRSSSFKTRLHVAWTWLLSSTMKTDSNYSASDCFETFPFPQPDPRAVLPALEAIGERVYNARALFMIDTSQGLTKTYNALKDPLLR